MSEPIPMRMQLVEAPTSFYIRFTSESLRRNVKQLERQISRHAVTLKRNASPPAIGSIYGFFHTQWTCMVRVRIHSFENSGWFKIFLLDYGYFMFNDDLTLFSEIPDEFKKESVIVHRASLVVKPCDNETKEPAKYWSEIALKYMRSFDQPGDVREYFFHTYGRHSDGTLMGDVTVESPYDPPFSITEKMIEANYAFRDESQFQLPPKKTAPSILKESVANFETIFSAFHSDYNTKRQVEKNPTRVTTLPVAAGVNHKTIQTSYKNANGSRTSTNGAQLNVQRSKSNFNAFQPVEHSNLPLQQQHVFPSPVNRSEVRPFDLLLFGKQLQAPFDSVAKAPFSKDIKDHLRTISNIQRHSWPQIIGGRSMLIIGDNSRSEPLDYLPAIASNVLQNRKNEIQGVGPVAIVIAKNATYGANIIRKLQMVQGINVVEALGSANKTVEVMNGCDFLVSTPASLCRLIDGVSLNVFNKNRIRHLVFDGIDFMLSVFQSEVQAIIRNCSNIKSKTDQTTKLTQLIFVSNAWIKHIEANFMSLMGPNKAVICIDSFIEAAASAGCTFSIAKISSTRDDKLANLVESLKDQSFKKVRTLIVTNGEESTKTVVKQLKAIEGNPETAKTLWSRETAGNYSIVVASDEVLSKMELRNVQTLIHFDVPKSWSSFANRFGVLMEEIYKNLEKKVEKPSLTTKVFLGDENSDQLADIINFLHTRKLGKVSDVYFEYVKRIKQHKEEEKREKNVKVCNNLFQFGDCPRYGCPSRHIFGKADVSFLQLRPPLSITFELITVNNPSSYTVKVKSHLVDSKWISLESQNEEIEELLDNDLQKYCNANGQGKVCTVVIGEIFAVLTHNKWKRCRVIEKKNQVVQATLIDSGTTEPFLASKLRSLPDKFKMRPLVYNLQMLNLIPRDREDVWENETTEKVKQLMAEVKDCTLSCHITLAIQNVLFADSFSAINKATGAFKLNLKNRLMKENICDFDEEVGKKLRQRVEEGKLLEASEAHEDSIEKPEITTQAPTIAESWKQLSFDTSYDVHVRHYKNPESFLVVLDMTEKKFLHKMLMEIEKCEVSSQLEEVKVGTVCALKRKDKNSRVKIIGITEVGVEVFLLDHGEISTCRQSDLYKLPNAMVTKLPFQTVHCRMIGLRPKYNMKTWPPRQSIEIRHLIKSYNNLKMLVARKNDKPDNLSLLGLNSYDVTLMDPEDGKHLDRIAVDKKFADLDKPVDCQLEMEKLPEDSTAMNAAESVESEASNRPTDNVDDVAVITNLLRQVSTGEFSDEGFEEKEIEAKASDSKASDSPTPVEVKKPDPPQLAEVGKLNYIFKHPKIEWRQNDLMVRLQISAVDCEDYGLKISDSSIEIVIKYKDRLEKTTFGLYNSVKVKLSQHELCGLSIIVRLIKFHSHLEWPRLTANNERSHFIKHNNADGYESDMNTQLSQLPQIVRTVPADLSDSSSDESIHLSDDEFF